MNIQNLLGSIGGVDAAVGLILPPILAVVQQSHWPWRVKANIAWVACLVVAVGIAYAQGQLTGDWSSAGVVGAKFAVILTVAKNTFDGFWKPNRVADAIEKATNVPRPLVSNEEIERRVQERLNELPDPTPIDDDLSDDIGHEIIEEAEKAG